MGNLKVIRTLFHRANIVVTDLEDQEREREHVKSEQELQKHVYEKEKKNAAAEIDSTKSANKTFVVSQCVSGGVRKKRTSI